MSQDETNDPGDLIAPCSECKTGVLHLQYITYFTWLNEELVTVQNFPAWVCDMCGRREYDPRAIKWLNMLLNPDAGRKRNQFKHRRPQRPQTDQLQP